MDKQAYPLEIIVVGVMHLLVALVVIVGVARNIILELPMPNEPDWTRLVLSSVVVAVFVGGEILLGSGLLLGSSRAYQMGRSSVKLYGYAALVPLFGRLVIGSPITPGRGLFTVAVLTVAVVTYVGLNTSRVKRLFPPQPASDDQAALPARIVEHLIARLPPDPPVDDSS